MLLLDNLTRTARGGCEGDARLTAGGRETVSVPLLDRWTTRKARGCDDDAGLLQVSL